MAGERTLPGLGLRAFYTAGSDDWGVAVSEDLRAVSALLGGAAKSRTTVLPGSPTDGDIYIVRSDDGTNPNKVALRDNGAWVYLTPAEGWRLWVSDEDVTVVHSGTAWAVQPVLNRPVAGGFVGIPTTDETLLLWSAVEAITFPANFAGSQGKIGINPTASFVLTVYKNPTFTGLAISGGTAIGTITISTGGAFTFATTGGAAQSLAAGDQLGVKAPTTGDATAACGSWTLLGRIG